MRGRVLLWFSLALNAALAAMLWYFFWYSPRIVTDRNPISAAASLSPDGAKVYKTNVVVRRQNFTWDQIESPDYATYIAKLRAIGCPEATEADSIAYRTAGMETLQHCTPMPFTEGMGGAIAGRTFRVRFDDRRNLPKPTEKRAWLITKIL